MKRSICTILRVIPRLLSKKSANRRIDSSVCKNLSGADLNSRDARFNSAQIDSAHGDGDSQTKLPSNFKKPNNWLK
jgi:hypothetical protein